MNNILTPKEQKEFKKRLKEVKHLYKFNLTKLNEKAEEIRQDIINNRNPNEIYQNQNKKIIDLIQTIPIISNNNLVPYSNILAKTSIFAPRKTNTNDVHTGNSWIKIYSPPHFDLYYNGPYLSMEDQNVYMLLIKKAEGGKGEEYITISQYEILKELQYKSLSNKAYEYLKKTIDKLIQSALKIVLKKSLIIDEDKYSSEITMHLIDEYSYDGESYSFKINKNSLFLYSANNYAWNDLDKKNEIKKKRQAPLTSWIYSFVLSESFGKHLWTIDKIYTLIGSKKKKADFKKDLEQSFESIKELNIIKSYMIIDGYVEWER